jgi:hypothetical protein
VTPIPVRDIKYRADRTEPLMFSPVDPHVIYYATNFLFKTADGGHSWQTLSPDLTRPAPGIPANLGDLAGNDPSAAKIRGVIYALGPSFKDLNTLWAGTDDGLIWITRDGGQNWKNITPPELTPWSKVTQITASHFDNESAYASVSRFRIDDLHPYIYRTRDGGQSWQKIVTGLPDVGAVDTVREDPVRKGLLFAGTENAVWLSFDDGDHWQSLQLNLPHTAMRDLWIHDDDLIVGTHGRSFWILDDITPLRQIAEAPPSEAYLFKPELAYRVRRDTNTDTPLPPDEPAGQNPPDGAIIDYYLPGAESAAVTLEILDGAGNVVRHYASTDKPEMTEEEMKKTVTVPLYWVRMPRILSSEAGMHRWVWDLHYTAPQSSRHEYPISAIPHDTPRSPQGPTALPGQYTVRLTAGSKTYTAPLTIKMDPRVETPPAGLEQQFKMEVRLAGLMNSSYENTGQARSLAEQLDKLSKQGQLTNALGSSISALQKKVRELLGAPGGFFAPPSAEATLTRVGGDIVALYGAVGAADATPTAAEVSALAASEQEFSGSTKRWEAIKAIDLAALNQQLSSAGLPQIKLEPAAQPEESSEDLE